MLTVTDPRPELKTPIARLLMASSPSYSALFVPLARWCSRTQFSSTALKSSQHWSVWRCSQAERPLSTQLRRSNPCGPAARDYDYLQNYSACLRSELYLEEVFVGSSRQSVESMEAAAELSMRTGYSNQQFTWEQARCQYVRTTTTDSRS